MARKFRSYGRVITVKPIVSAAAGSSNLIKTVDGLAWASIKTINGLAVASIKKFNGLTAQ